MRSNLINYPTAKQVNRPMCPKDKPKSGNQQAISASKRGMSLETLLSQANDYYRSQNIACIHKKPTPVQVVSVDYRTRATAKITEAYYSMPSTTDFNGVFNGHYLDFEAKQTQLLSLPFNNFHSHQIDHMEQVIKQHGICFVIISFIKVDKIFLVPAIEIIRLYRASPFSKQRKSLSLDQAQQLGYEIDTSSYPIVDYLKTIKKYVIGGVFVGK